MTDREKELESFKQDFLQRLDAFMVKRQEEIGDPSDWKVRALLRGYREYPQVAFKHKLNPHRSISFTTTPLPEDLFSDEGMALRQFANNACAERGFEPTKKPRPSPLSDSVLTGVRKGEPEAWNRFVEKHYGTFVQYASETLNNKQNSTLLESEDVANGVLFDLFRYASNGGLRPDQNPHSLVNQNIARRELQGRQWQRQAGGGNFRDLPQAEYDGRVEALEAQLPKVLEKAKKRMTPRQREVLDAILANEEESLTTVMIGEKLGVTKVSARQHMKNISEIIQQAAHDLGCEEIAHYIDHLVRANGRGYIKR